MAMFEHKKCYITIISDLVTTKTTLRDMNSRETEKHTSGPKNGDEGSIKNDKKCTEISL